MLKIFCSPDGKAFKTVNPSSQHPHGGIILNTKHIVSTLLDQNKERYEKLWDDLLKLPPEAFNQTFKPDNLSIAEHLLLVIGELQRWTGFISGQRDNKPVEIQLGVNQDLINCFNQWGESFAAAEILIHQQTQRDLENSLNGIQGPVWEVLVHMMMVAEEHHHYIVTILAQMGILDRPHSPNRDLWQFQTESLPEIRPERTISC